MNHVPDIAKDVAKVATEVAIVVATSVKDKSFRDLGSFAFQALKGLSFTRSPLRRDNSRDFVSCEARYQELREGSRRQSRAMDPFGGAPPGSNDGLKKTQENSSIGQGDVPQPEDLFAPKNPQESKESTPFKPGVDAGVAPLSQKVTLPSVEAHLPPK